MQISFIGLGHMGNPMVRNLLKAGHRVRVFDVSQESMQALVKHNAIAAQSLKEVVLDADVVITMVQTGQQVQEICVSAEGIFKYLKPTTLYIDCSTIDVAVTKSLHESSKKYHLDMVDAPVSGGVAGAEAGTLTFMVGGADANYERALPILQCMGKKVVHAGDAGSGQAAKICNNLLLAISMIGTCEAFTLAKKLGLAPKKFFDISSSASGQCWSMTSYCPEPGIVDNVPSNHDYKPGFMAKMMLKDLRLGVQAANSVNASIPLGMEATELYELFVNQGNGEVDFSGIINFIKSK